MLLQDRAIGMIQNEEKSSYINFIKKRQQLTVLNSNKAGLFEGGQIDPQPFKG